MVDVCFIAFPYFFVLLLLVAFCYVLGKGCLQIIFKTTPVHSSYTIVFYSLLAGVFILISLVSLISTKGKTIHLLFLLVAYFLYMEYRLSRKRKTISINEKSKTQHRLDLKTIFSLFILIGLVFLWQAVHIFKTDGFPVANFEKDNVYYAEISKSLISSGYENTFSTANLIASEYHYPTAYHYFELWLNGCVSSCFSLNAELSLYLITNCFFVSLILLGSLALMSHYTKIRFKHKTVVVLLLFVGGLSLSKFLFNQHSNAFELEGISERFGEKLAAAYAVIICALLIGVSNKQLKSGIILLLTLPLLSISLAPGVFGGLILYCLYKLIRYKEERTFYARLLVYTAMLMGGIELFYFYHQTNNLDHRLNKALLSYSDLHDVTFFSLKYFLKELYLKLYAAPFFFVLNYVPFVLVILYLIIKKQSDRNFRTFLGLFVLMALMGLVFSKTFYAMEDAFQFYTTVLLVWHVFFIFSVIQFIFRPHQKGVIRYGISLLLAATCLLRVYISQHSYQCITYPDVRFSDRYLLEVNRILNKTDTEMKGGIFYDHTYYKKAGHSYPFELYFLPFISHSEVWSPFNLSSNRSLQKSANTLLLENTPFNRYVNQTGNEKKSDFELQISFIRANRLSYLILPKEQTKEIKKYFRVTTEVKDSLSGQRFLIIDPGKEHIGPKDL